MGKRDDPIRRALAEEGRRLDLLAREAKSVAGAVLEAAGFHRHDRGAWRRRRATRGTNVAESDADLNDCLALARRDQNAARALFDKYGSLSTDGAKTLIKVVEADLAHEAIEATIGRMEIRDQLRREGIRRHLDEVRRDLEGPGPAGGAERLIVDRAVACYLAVQEAAGALAHAERHRRARTFDLKRVESAERRFLGVIKALDQLRKKVPASQRLSIKVRGNATFGAAPPGGAVIDLTEPPPAPIDHPAPPED